MKILHKNNELDAASLGKRHFYYVKNFDGWLD